MKKNSQQDTPTDEELVVCAQGGDKKATEELLSRHLNLVRGIARRFFLVGGETEDLIQEGMIGLYQAIGDYRPKESGSAFASFAYLCVYRRIVDAVKSATRKKNEPLIETTPIDEWETGGPSPEDIIIFNEDKRKLYQQMSGVLSDFEFKIVVMYIDGFTYAEICETLGRSAKSVDNALQRSKKKLQSLLKK